MAITWTLENEARRDLGISAIEQPAKAAFAASDYTTTGYAVAPKAFGLQVIRNLKVGGIAGANATTNLTTTYVFSYNRLTQKLQAFGGAASGVALAEAANGADLSAFTLYVVAEGF